jgi:hypothetical protein
MTAVFIAMMYLVAGNRAMAGTIAYNDEIFHSGSGIGNVATILVLQNTPSEAGSVTWNGSADVVVPDAKSQSRTWSVTDLATSSKLDSPITAADDQFGVVFNIDDTNNNTDVYLNSLTISFLKPDGTALFSSITYTGPPNAFDEDSQGTGSSGFLFRVTLTPGEITAFFGNPGNRLGASASVNLTDNGQDTFYLVDLSGNPPIGPPIPEPSTLILCGLGLAALGLWRRNNHK